MTLEPERKIRAIVFSDIKGYSKMMGADESLALRLLEEHNAICTPLIARYGGTVLKFIGDAILSSFEGAADAVNYGIAVQKALSERNAGRPERERITVRIGIHIGDVVFKDGDVFGDGVNVAARIEPLAEPGGIAISQTVYDLIRARPEIQTVSLGAKELKNIKESVKIYKVLVDAQQGASLEAERGRRRRAASVAGCAVLLLGAVSGLAFALMRRARLRNELLENPGFEQGADAWTSEGAPVNVGDVAGRARSGRGYAEAFLAPGSRSATVWAGGRDGKVRQFPVSSGDVVSFGVWTYKVSGDESPACKLRASVEDDRYESWIGPSEGAVKTGAWVLQRGSYVVQPGKASVAFFVEILAADDVAARTATVARFDDAFLRIDRRGKR